MRRPDRQAVDEFLDRLARSRRVDRLLRRLPDQIGEPIGLSLQLRWHRRHEVRDMSTLCPPDDEKVRSRLAWVAEAYAPSDLPSLLTGVRDLGLDASRWERHTISRSVVDARRATEGWSYYSLGMIRSPGEGFLLLDQVEAELPDGVVAALPGLYLLPGSVSVLVITFLFDAVAAARVDDVLRQPHERTGRRTPRGWSFRPPELSQRDAVRDALAAQRLALTEWTARRVGGAFARHGDHGLPTAQLVTYRTAEAVSPAGLRDWRRSLALAPSVGDWRSESWPAVRMHRSSQPDERAMLRLSAHEQTLRATHDEARRELDEDAAWWLIFQRLHESFEGLVALHALSQLVDLYAARLSDLRDAAGAAGDRPRQAGRRIGSVRRELEITADARAVASDLREEIPAFFFSGDGDWLEQLPDEHPRAGVPRVGWISGVASSLPRRAIAILELERQVRERLATEAQLISAAASLRLQRYAFWIALLALVAAIAAVAVGVAQLQG
jgi:hypothetical protein